MKKSILFFLLAFFLRQLYGQSVYKGFIDKYPVELDMYTYSDETVDGIYAYQNFDNSIYITGTIKNNRLVLSEKNQQKITATLTFENYGSNSQSLTGVWKDLQTNKQLKISLNKEFDIDSGEELEWKNKEILQPVSLKRYYFKLLISKSKDDLEPRVTGIKILQKKTDSLIQQIEIDCQIVGLHNTSTGDYNFDGNQDFSVFESGYAGPNTSSLYFLYNAVNKKFVDSKFEGTSLEFDAKTKTIHEHNQCCAGTVHTTAIYKVVNNKMVLIEQHCFKWDEEKEDLVERDMKDCQ